MECLYDHGHSITQLLVSRTGEVIYVSLCRHGYGRESSIDSIHNCVVFFVEQQLRDCEQCLTVYLL
jgi:hypothetical protein